MDEEERRKIGLKYLKTIDGEVGDEVIKAREFDSLNDTKVL